TDLKRALGRGNADPTPPWARRGTKDRKIRLAVAVKIGRHRLISGGTERCRLERNSAAEKLIPRIRRRPENRKICLSIAIKVERRYAMVRFDREPSISGPRHRIN